MLFERLFMSQVYGSNVLMQLLVCYAVILIFDDLVKIIWGPRVPVDGHARRVPAAADPLMGGVIPPFYLFMIGAAMVIGPAAVAG